jgi:Meiotically up-regulated gene 113
MNTVLDELITGKGGFVYLMRVWIGGDFYYKIGRSQNPNERRNRLSVPGKLEIVDSYYSSNVEADESKWYQKFSSKLVNGEWFKLDVEDLAARHQDRIPWHAPATNE